MQLDIKRAFFMAVAERRWFETLLIGALAWLVASALALVPYVGGMLNMLLLCLPAGYCLRVMRAETTATQATLPKNLPQWDNWEELFKDGVVITLVNSIYALVIGVLAFLATAALGLTSVFAQAASGGIGQVPAFLILVWFAVMAAVATVCAVFMPLVSAHFAHERRVAAGFEALTVLKRLFARPANVLVAALVSLATVFVVSIGSLTVVFAPVLVFAAQVILSNIWAQVYRLGASDTSAS